MAEKEAAAPSAHWGVIIVLGLVLAFIIIVTYGFSNGTGEGVNIEYFFRLLYDCIHGQCYVHASTSSLTALVSNIWLWVTVIGYLLSVLAIILIVYCTVLLFELRHKEEHELTTLIAAPETSRENRRWTHIQELISGASPSDWRQAIIEADIMLEDVLADRGYPGDSIGEKLQSAGKNGFATLQDAWEAHKVRNQIAHEGSMFDLTQTFANRTLSRYENVFREFGAV